MSSKHANSPNPRKSILQKDIQTYRERIEILKDDVRREKYIKELQSNIRKEQKEILRCLSCIDKMNVDRINNANWWIDFFSQRIIEAEHPQETITRLQNYVKSFANELAKLIVEGFTDDD